MQQRRGSGGAEGGAAQPWLPCPARSCPATADPATRASMMSQTTLTAGATAAAEPCCQSRMAAARRLRASIASSSPPSCCACSTNTSSPAGERSSRGGRRTGHQAFRHHTRPHPQRGRPRHDRHASLPGRSGGGSRLAGRRRRARCRQKSYSCAPGLAIFCSAHSNESRRPSRLSLPATTSAGAAGLPAACGRTREAPREAAPAGMCQAGRSGWRTCRTAPMQPGRQRRRRGQLHPKRST